MRNQESHEWKETADVLVVGGGVIGLSIARALTKRGVRDVILIERSGLGLEASSAAGGMLAPQAEADNADDFFHLATASRDLYPSFGECLREESGIDIELERTGTLYLAFTEHDLAETERRFDWQSRAGMVVEKLSGDEARSLEPAISPLVQSALRFPLDTQVENRKLIAALCESARKSGVRLLCGLNADSLIFDGARIAGVRTHLGTIWSPAVVLAAGAWTSFLAAGSSNIPPIRVEPVRGQMLCFESNPRIARHVIYSPRGYLIPRLDGRLIAGSTTEYVGFEKHVTASGLNTITANALEIAPVVGALKVSDSWAGLRPKSIDDLPVLGACASAPGLYFATGHYRNGILLAPVTGELIAEEVTTGVAPEQARPFSPDRFNYAHV